MAKKANESGRYDKLVLRYGYLREECADLFERLNHLEHVEGPELSSRYMIEIGQFEMRIFELSIAIRRWRRRFELRQMSLNEGRKPDFVAIETELDRQFEEFTVQLEQHVKMLNAATSHLHRGTLTERQTVEMRCLYLKAAKRLHPDVNAVVTPPMEKLWQKIKTAYTNRSWTDVQFLCGLIDTVAEKTRSFPDTKEGLAELESEIARLEHVVREHQMKIEEMKGRPPWSYAEMLADTEKVKATQRRLKESIDALTVRVEGYEKEWKGVLP